MDEWEESYAAKKAAVREMATASLLAEAAAEAAKMIRETIRQQREARRHDNVFKIRSRQQGQVNQAQQVQEQLATLEKEAISRAEQQQEAHHKRACRFLYQNSAYSQRDGDEIEAERKAYYARKELKAKARMLRKQGGLDGKQRHVLKAYGIL